MSKTDEEVADEWTFLGEISGGRNMWIRPALREQDHEAIANVAAQSKVCATFPRATYSSEAMYAAGRIRVLVDVGADGTQRCVGFSCSKPREDETAVFFLAVDERVQRKGCGTELLIDLQERSEARRISSTLPKSCEGGLAFASARGFYTHGQTAKGGIRLRLDDVG